MVLASDTSLGAYVVRFWVDGRWQAVVVDDRVPVLRSTSHPDRCYPAYAECYQGAVQGPQGVYVAVLEKVSL